MIFFPSVLCATLLLSLLTTYILEDVCRQNAVLLIISYMFYAWWDWRFLALLVAVSGIIYIAAKRVHTSRLALFLGLGLPLLSLGVCKYLNFFLDSFYALIGSPPSHTWNLILPLGISFYTFLAISYLLDVYYGKLVAEENFLIVALYIGFFPSVVSGPITKSRDLIEQFHQLRTVQWDNLQFGFQRFLMGCLKKAVLADHLGVLVDDVFQAPLAFDSATVWLAVVAYSLQLYFDFSGYSDMAIGCARCLGFTLSENFNLPYIASNVSEFWKRWHISLSAWFQEYVYFPLGGSRFGDLKTYCNLMITMLICGLWHGAAWRFVLWGGAHGALLCIYHFYRASTMDKIQLPAIMKILVTYLSVALCWIFFRGTDMQNISEIFYRLFVWENFGIHQMYVYAWLSIVILIAVSMYSIYCNEWNGLLPDMDIRRPTCFFVFWLEIFFLFGLMYVGNNPFVYASF